jgi:hypothetical protein
MNNSSCRSILMAAENVIRDLPSIGYCNKFLLGSKYEKTCEIRKGWGNL